MCVDIPARVLAVDPDGSFATTDRGGKAARASLVILEAQGRRVRAGDWLSVNAGIAVRVLNDTEARETLHWYEEMEAESS